MAARDSKKRPSNTEAGAAEKRSKFDPRNIAAPPSKSKAESGRRSVMQIPSEASTSTARVSSARSQASSVGPGNKTIITDGSDSDEVFECALQVNAAQAKDMATTAKQKRRANEALLKEVRHTYTFTHI